MQENVTALRSQQSIEDALLELLRQMPYAEITISRIADRAGLSRQAFYRNYRDKAAVMDRIMLKLFGEIMDAVRKAEAGTIEELVEVYTDYVEVHIDLLQLIAANDLSSRLGTVITGELMKLPPVLPCQREIRTREEGVFFNSFWVSAFISVYTEWLREAERADRSELNRILSDIMYGHYFNEGEEYGKHQ